MVSCFLGIKINFKGEGVNEIGFVTGIEGGKHPKSKLDKKLLKLIKIF